jgi:hypothetical protein
MSHAKSVVTIPSGDLVSSLVGRVVAVQRSQLLADDRLLVLQNQHWLGAEITACRNTVIEDQMRYIEARYRK